MAMFAAMPLFPGPRRYSIQNRSSTQNQYATENRCSIQNQSQTANPPASVE
jgi:hypothetical protein